MRTDVLIIASLIGAAKLALVVFGVKYWLQEKRNGIDK